MSLYKITFYRINTVTKPTMRQEVDVLIRAESIDEVTTEVIYKNLWKQYPELLQCNGPSIVGFAGWSSVMPKEDSLIEVEQRDRQEMKEDLTGEGNWYTPLTYHPLLPYDGQVALRKAYERGVRDTKKGATQ